MKLIANTDVFKEKIHKKRVFSIDVDTIDDQTLKTTIITKLDIDTDKWEMVKDEVKYVKAENLVLYKSEYKKKELPVTQD